MQLQVENLFWFGGNFWSSFQLYHQLRIDQVIPFSVFSGFFNYDSGKSCDDYRFVVSTEGLVKWHKKVHPNVATYEFETKILSHHGFWPIIVFYAMNSSSWTPTNVCSIEKPSFWEHQQNYSLWVWGSNKAIRISTLGLRIENISYVFERLLICYSWLYYQCIQS